MSDEKPPEHQWELSKENIQPIKGGRRVENLNESLLKLHDESFKRERKLIQEQYESTIRTYSGSDPLEAHHRYINWLRMTYPTGSKELLKVIENCLREFRHDDRYKNDVRYLEAWLAFVEICGDEKLTVFKSLFDRGIGTMSAELYVAWSGAYEAGNNFKRAREVFEHGTACGAQPSTLLKRKFEQFCQRALAHEFASESATATPAAAAAAAAAAAPSSEGVRQAMASLKLQASGPRGAAVVDPVRVGPHVVSSVPRGLNTDQSGSSLRPTENFFGDKVNIFSDSVVGGHGAGGLGSDYSLALHSPAAHSTVAVDKLVAGATARNQENERIASKWTEASLAPRDARSEVTQTTTPDIAGFTIYTDEDRRSPEGRQLTGKGPTPGIRLSAMKAAPEAVAAHHAFALLEADTAASAGGVRRLGRAMQPMGGGRGFGAAGDETPAMASGMQLSQAAVSSALGEPKVKMDAVYPKGPNGPELSLEELRAQRHRARRGSAAPGEPKMKMMIKMDAVYPKGPDGTEMSFEELRAQCHRRGFPKPAVKAGPHVKMMYRLDAVLPDGPAGPEMSFEELRARRHKERRRSDLRRREADSEKLPLATRTRRCEKEVELEVEAARLEDRRRALEARRSATQVLEREAEQREAEARRRSAEAQEAARKAEEHEREAQARCVELTKKTAEVEAALVAKQQQLAMLEKRIAEQEEQLRMIATRREQAELGGQNWTSWMDSSCNRKRAGSLLCTPRHDSAISAATPGPSSGRPPSRKNARRPAEEEEEESNLRTPWKPAEAAALKQSVGVTPTVNTKFAINIMQQLFDSSADQQAQDTLCLEEAEEDLNRLPASTAGRVPPGALPRPFEENERKQRRSPETGRRRRLEAQDPCGATPVTLPMSPVERAYLRSARRQPDATAAPLPADFNIFSDPSISDDQQPAQLGKGGHGTAGAMPFKIFSGSSISEDNQQSKQAVKESPGNVGAVGFKIFSDPSISDDRPPAQPVKESHDTQSKDDKIFLRPCDNQQPKEPVRGGHSNSEAMIFKSFSDPSFTDSQQCAHPVKADHGNARAVPFSIFSGSSIVDDDQQAQEPMETPHSNAGAMPFKIFSGPSIVDDDQQAEKSMETPHSNARAMPFKIFSGPSIVDDDQQAEEPMETPHSNAGAMPFKIFSDVSKADQQPKRSYDNIKPIGFEIFSDPSFRSQYQSEREGNAFVEKRPAKLAARTPGVGSDLDPSSAAASRWSDRNWGPPVGASDSGVAPAVVTGLGAFLETDVLTDMVDNCRVNDPDVTFAPEYHSTQNVKNFLANQVPDFQKEEPLGSEEPAEVEPVAALREEPLENEELDSVAKEQTLLHRNANLTAIQEVSEEKDSRSTHSDLASSYGLGFSRRSLARRSSPLLVPLQGIREATGETSSVFQNSTSNAPAPSFQESTRDETLAATERNLRTDPGAAARQMEVERSFDGSRHLGLAAQASRGATEAHTPPPLEFPEEEPSGELQESGLYGGDLRNTNLLLHLAGLTTVDSETDIEKSTAGELKRYGDHTILIDEPARHHVEELAERTSYFTTNLVITDIKDPYKGRVVKQLMNRVMPELQALPDFITLTSFRATRDRLVFNDCELLVDNSFSRVQGGFGEVMLVRDPADNSKWILKKHYHRYPLEFYFLREARKRLCKAASVHERQTAWVDVSDSICFARRLYCEEKSSFLLLQHYPLGTMLTFRNRLQKMVEPVAVYFTFELLHIIDQLHRVGIIHGDLKPDNIVLKDRFPQLPEDYTGGLPGQRTHVVCFIDFGRAIDLKFFGRDACFLSDGGVKGFECLEMKVGRPWNFQVDLFNVASTVFAIIRGVYMTVSFKEDVNKWVPTNLLEITNKRLWKLGSYWQSLLETLINVPSCSPADYPNLAELRAPLENYLRENRALYNRQIEFPNSIL